ncbi:hypothetical protein [Methylomicrobium sp. Wu6]|uniref:hypothetical protein n=1 Tax=Methylomicrobium sp. Wu6 TaxID=3107928 RepID=UPI002DD6458B|nr:hypothetical protein [Methylomicrobium sp. Wu6]MEC4747730.1 hypothetical protein [Methylomicrobium sp. Wu6]
MACEQANGWDRSQYQRLKEARKADERRIRALERDPGIKEKALAETAALLVLRKKAQAIWDAPHNSKKSTPNNLESHIMCPEKC